MKTTKQRAVSYRFVATLGVAVSVALIMSACQQSPTAPAAIGNATAVPGQALAAKGGGKGANVPKEDVCHLDDDGVFSLINVSGNAVSAHLAHGDGQPGDGSFDNACGTVVFDPGPFTASLTAEACTQAVTLSCPAGVIQVIQGLYGQICADASYIPPPPYVAGDPDKTADLALACDRSGTCNYVIDCSEAGIGDPFFGCSKEYEVEWACVPD